MTNQAYIPEVESSTPEPSIAVLRRFPRGWPIGTDKNGAPKPLRFDADNCDAIEASAPASEVFDQEYPDDHHFVAYEARCVDLRADEAVAGAALEAWPVRLTSDAVCDGNRERLQPEPNVKMQLLVVDVDGADHVASAAWRDGEYAKLDALEALAPGFFYYESKGGYRLVWRLAVPFLIESRADADAWKVFYLGALGWLKVHTAIEGDTACQDWTRLYRLPRVLRDGVAQTPVILGALGLPWLSTRNVAPSNDNAGAKAPKAKAKPRGNKAADHSDPKGGDAALVDPLISALAEALTPAWCAKGRGWFVILIGWMHGKGWSRAERARLLDALEPIRSEKIGDYRTRNNSTIALQGPGEDLKKALGEAFARVDELVCSHPSAGGVFNPFIGTEQGDAHEYAADHAHEIRWILEWGKFAGWDGKRWAVEGGELIAQRAWRDTLKKKLRDAAEVEDDDKRKGRLDYVRSCMTRRHESNVIALAQSRLAIENSKLDADPWLLNLSNGLLDLRTATLRKHDSAAMCTKLTAVAWDANATCPRWLTFLNWAMKGDGELVSYLQRFFGLCLSGDASHEVLHVFYGDGANGKTTATVVLEALLGSYASRAPAKLLMASKYDSHPTEIADFVHRRLVTLAETKEDQVLDDQVLKLVASRDPIAARRMYEDFWHFDPTHKALLLTNHRPGVQGQDHGIWRRIALIPWANTIAEHEKDRDLPSKLIGELPGILAWAVVGCLDVQRGGLRPPTAVKDATAGYRTQEDAVARWVAAECDLGNDCEARARSLCGAYNAWAMGAREVRLSERAFADRLKRLGYVSDTRRDGVHWRGLRVRLHSA